LNFGLLFSLQKVKKDIGDVTILVNNAGVITAADFLSTQEHQIERMFEVNILGHMWTTRAFLPVMMNNNYGHIVTVASAAGHFVIPYMVVYCSPSFKFLSHFSFHVTLSSRVFPERALNLLKKISEVKFDAIIGQRSTQ
ncbi:estradiol 17-beta-dehydrogenase 11-like, partial [Passer montanus]|uniref:estradiol 17-beta-dehydrogenase 11-like n=1 Tax=Passer montanus TaxID=9160 RepID=UPI001962260A